MITTSWFVLPPVQEYYFKSKHVSYNSLPPFKSNCTDPASIASMDIVYPKPNSKIYLPRNLDGTLGNTIFEAAHRSATAIVYWHLDGNFVATTKKHHRLPMTPTSGTHQLTLVDDHGEIFERSFKVISKQ